MDEKSLQITNHDFLIYRDSNNDVKVSVMLINNDIWLTQNLIAELFGVGRSTITEHINNILNSGELDENNTVGKTDVDNSKKPVKIYNLDMIIAVGYRVNSKKATNFRIWATKILKEYMIKGVVMDDERLKNPNYIFGEDYFEETLYLDYAELQAENHNAMTMKDWVEKLNAFLQFNGKEILHNAGKISAKVAQELAYKEYDKFKIKQDKLYKSDFDNFLNEARMIENGSENNE